MANKISLYGLISVNGVYATPSAQGDSNPTAIDLTSEKIAYVSVVKAVTQNGATVDAFEIVCSNLKGATPDKYLLKVTANCATIDAFFTGLSTVTSDTTFTKYTSVLSIGGSAIQTPKSVIINDLHTKNRRYVPQRGTIVFVDIHNAYQALEFVFSGDQTVAGNYTYFPA